jgi:hypothetical protein
LSDQTQKQYFSWESVGFYKNLESDTQFGIWRRGEEEEEEDDSTF